eukprot:795180-Pelagomonas_calceolata.AAC.2
MGSLIEVGRLQDGFDEDDFRTAFLGDGSDGSDDDHIPGNVVPWLEDALSIMLKAVKMWRMHKHLLLSLAMRQKHKLDMKPLSQMTFDSN